MGHTTAKDLQYYFNEKLKSHSASELLKSGMDGPNVNWSFYDKLCDQRSKVTRPELVETESCGLHILHGSFKAGKNLTDWKIGKTLKTLFNLFSDSPIRTAGYIELSHMSYAALILCKGPSAIAGIIVNKEKRKRD